MPKTIEQIDQLGRAIKEANEKFANFQTAREELNVSIQELDMKLAAFKAIENPAPPPPATGELPG